MRELVSAFRTIDARDIVEAIVVLAIVFAVASFAVGFAPEVAV